MMKREITITPELIEEEEGGYTFYCPELDIYTQGEDVEDAIENLKEAAELHIEEIGINNLNLKHVKHKKSRWPSMPELPRITGEVLVKALEKRVSKLCEPGEVRYR